MIGSVGRVLESHKRFSDLVRAMPRILACIPKARLLIVGDGELRDPLDHQIRKLGLDRHVALTARPRTEESYRATYVDGMARALDALAEPPERAVLVSSTAVHR